MPATGDRRRERRHETGDDGHRDPFQRDRDRILYSSALRRLNGVSQIVRAGEEDIFHNRLIHTIKVAQIGRRLAEKLIEKQPEEAEIFGLNPDVVEAACLGHDLGHPPFGHVGEKAIDGLLTSTGDGGTPLDREGFEGNAQSFRIVTKLAVRHPDCDGLDLTRATLAALQKYPWPRSLDKSGPDNPERESKWGYYRTEQDDFDFCRQDHPGEGVQTLEAEIMDYADDITYSIHDLEDFHRGNAIPWSRLFGENAEDRDRIIREAERKWRDAPPDARCRLETAFQYLNKNIKDYYSTFLTGPYEGERDQRLQTRSFTSFLIGRYVGDTKIVEQGQYKPGRGFLKIGEDFIAEVKLLKQIAWKYVISSPSLNAQRRGQKRIIKQLFYDFYDEFQKGAPDTIPKRFLHFFDTDDGSPARKSADCIASLSEREAMAMHQRLNGLTSGSVLDPIVR